MAMMSSKASVLPKPTPSQPMTPAAAAAWKKELAGGLTPSNPQYEIVRQNLLAWSRGPFRDEAIGPMRTNPSPGAAAALRSNAGGALRGQARASQVQALNALKTNPSPGAATALAARAQIEASQQTRTPQSAIPATPGAVRPTTPTVPGRPMPVPTLPAQQALRQATAQVATPPQLYRSRSRQVV